MKFDVRCVLMMAYLDLKTQRDEKYGFIIDGGLQLPSQPLIISADHVIRNLADQYIEVDYSFLQINRLGFYEDLANETVYLLFRTRFPYFVRTKGIHWVSINALRSEKIAPHFVNMIAQGMTI